MFPLLQRLLKALTILSFFAVTQAWAIRPLVLFQDLVAGDTSYGLRNGSFVEAQFAHPAGLAVSPDGNTLFVADTMNHALRAIALNDANRVTTVTGQGTNSAGYRDGSLATAQFNLPRYLACVSNTLVVVDDHGNNRLRMVDLKAKTVSTLMGLGGPAVKADGGNPFADGDLFSIVYDPKRDALLFSQPAAHAVRMLDMKTRKVTDLIADEPMLPSPGPLCIVKDILYVADSSTLKVWECKWDPAAKPDVKPYTFQDMGTVTHPLALSYSDGSLYALQGDAEAPWYRIFPDPAPVTLVSTWGHSLDSHWPPSMIFFNSQVNGYTSIVPDPVNERRFFITNTDYNTVVSIRDLRQADLSIFVDTNLPSRNGLRDFDYPVPKPPGTFRIAVFGRSFASITFAEDSTKHAPQDKGNKMDAMTKKLELMLTTEAALQDLPVRFEVFNEGMIHPLTLNLAFLYEAPKIVEKFDVDLVILLQDMQAQVFPYVTHPLTAEGIPQEDADAEYLLKPLKERNFPADIADFLDLCRKKKYVFEETESQIVLSEPEPLIRDPETRPMMLRLIGRPIALALEKMSHMPGADGKPPRFLMLYTPLPKADTDQSLKRDFFKEVSDRNGFPWMELTDEISALRVSYFPMGEQTGMAHFSAEGHTLMAYLIARKLMAGKYLPYFGGEKSLISPKGPRSVKPEVPADRQK